MFVNYARTAIRNVLGSWLYSAINITGLGIGLACCLLILLFVRFETSYEKSFANAERLYRVSREYFPNEGARARVPAMTNWPIGEVLPQAFSDVEAMGRIFGGNLSLRRDELFFAEPALRFADNSLLDMFGFDWLAGDPSAALAEPGTLVLTESLARKYFGDVNPIGQTLRVQDTWDARVTGLIRDLPANTHLDLSGMMSLATLTNGPNGNAFAASWNNTTDFYTYILLREGASIDAVTSGIPAFLDRYVGENESRFSTLDIMNIRDIHLRSDRDEEMKPHGSIDAVYGFTSIAFSILLIACINFISISTARSSQRAREVGVRRAIGASRRELVSQFLSESSLTTLIAIAVALVLVELALPAFSAFTGTVYTFEVFTDPGILMIVACLTLFTAVAAGSYPAFFLANLGAGRMLRGHMSRDAAALRFRNALVVLQFSIAIALVIATVVIYQQRQLANDIDLGFERDNIVVLQTPARSGFRADWASFKQGLLANPAIESATISHFLPFGFNDNQMPVLRGGMTEAVRIQYMLVDYDFFETYGMNLLAGRSFTPDFPGDAAEMRSAEAPEASTSYVVNAAAARALGLQVDSAVDEVLRVPVPLPNITAELTGPIVGVVNDTYFESIRSNVRPLIFMLSPTSAGGPLIQTYRQASVRVDPDAVPAALAHIRATWEASYPGQQLAQRFLTEDFTALYRAEDRQGMLLLTFAALAILIACFGLFGLASFNAERRTKEIGVRKAIGGSVWSIVLLLTNDFSKLVLVANVIAWPFAYVAMDRWLEGFAYRVDLAPLIFIGSGLIALCVAWVTVGGTAAKAASTKPVLALRYE